MEQPAAQEVVDSQSELGAEARCQDHAHVFPIWAAQAQIHPLAFAGRKGFRFWDYDGRQYLDFASQLINANPCGSGTGIFASSGACGRKFQREIKVGTVGVNSPIPAPVVRRSFGDWNVSLFGGVYFNSSDGARFYTHSKVAAQRWPRSGHELGASFAFSSHDYLNKLNGGCCFNVMV